MDGRRQNGVGIDISMLRSQRGIRYEFNAVLIANLAQFFGRIDGIRVRLNDVRKPRRRFAVAQRGAAIRCWELRHMQQTPGNMKLASRVIDVGEGFHGR